MKAKGEAWPQMSAADADKECGTLEGFYPDTCGVCESKIILHCDKCKIQVSGCQCILQAKVAEIQRDREIINGIEQSEALRDRLANEGLWLPPLA